jgi:hypothetical protein
VLVLAYSIVSFIYQEKIIEMNDVYSDEATVEAFAEFRQTFDEWILIIVLRYLLLFSGMF